MSDLVATKVPTSNIPLLGCGGPGDPGEAILTTTLTSSATGTTYIKAGDRLCEAFCDGPANFVTGDGIWIPGATVDLTAQATMEAAGDWESIYAGTIAADHVSGNFLHDTRDWYAHHNGTVNLLMADGSVKPFKDQNGDGYLNPGFTGFDAKSAAGDPGEAGSRTVLFEEGPVELPVQECFSGVFLIDPTGGKPGDTEQ
jgi:prepilin-type processing-associated H-X9-DG protein